MKGESGQEEILHLFREAGAFIGDDHFVYDSGRHGPVYVNKDAIFANTHTVAGLGKAIAKHFHWRGAEYEVVVGPEKGGIILSQWVAYHSCREGHDVLAAFAEKEEPEAGLLYREFGYAEPPKQRFVFRPSYRRLLSGRKVLVVEDVLTTGGTVNRVVGALQALECEVVGVGVLVNREGVTAEDCSEVPHLYSLIDLRLTTWSGEECPLCREGRPVNLDYGKGGEFLARQARAS